MAAVLERSDRELAQAAAAGDERAFAELVERHRTELVRFCERRLAGDGHRAEDVAQESLIRLQRSLRAGQSIDNVRAWLRTVARNAAIDDLRKTTRVVLTEPPDVALESTAPDDPHLEVAWQGLRSRHREVLRLRELDGLAYEEIARRMATSVAAVETLLFRARAALRREYARAGGQLAAFGPVDVAVRQVATGDWSAPRGLLARLGVAAGDRVAAGAAGVWSRVGATMQAPLGRMAEVAAAGAVVVGALTGGATGLPASPPVPVEVATPEVGVPTISAPEAPAAPPAPSAEAPSADDVAATGNDAAAGGAGEADRHQRPIRAAAEGTVTAVRRVATAITEAGALPDPEAPVASTVEHVTRLSSRLISPR